MRYVSLFSGIEAATVAWEPLGWEPVAFAEVDPFCCEVLKYRFPEVPNLGDVRSIDWRRFVEDHGRPDVVVGGSPCQSFSVAGRREGLAGESGLMYEYIRAVSELRPAYFVWENVPGAFSSEEGEAFRQLLNEMDELGYGMAWRVLDAQFFGVAQRRRRVFVVGVLGDGAAPAEVLFEPEGLEWDLPSGKVKRKELADAARRGDGCADGMDEGCIGFNHNASGSRGMAESIDLSPTLRTCNGAKPNSNNVPAVMAFCAGNTAGAGSLGAQWEVSPTLRAGASGTNQVPTVCMADANANAAIDVELCGTLKVGGEPPICFTQNTRDEVRLVGGDGSLSGALCSRPGAKQQSYVVQSAEVDHGAVWQWPWIVRRLTPRECERLQGFPDDWTLVPYRGRPADEFPDSPRYSALGNSFAVPVVRWIGERIARVDSSLGLAG
ncbi:DNA cytosine methyltransferase [Raoultibacter timonensis]|uniref:Cytosine-specific methyltransferase n=1 Tax=Raoultibacter timonensis TaxID=1907662 RepID=A0ABN6MA84_9ACTN|nr:DNA cytosine methyltransferase [Raoultibacter timonensis]BDE94923.1 cytosine-specific methyltransferase [Raoultibacter timonensis]BDF49526.1 cytosine-specific methyltransferase [Raoultibacter timonensis]